MARPPYALRKFSLRRVLNDSVTNPGASSFECRAATTAMLTAGVPSARVTVR